jgi:hypothetical protein
MIKICVICGESFQCSPSEKKVTCARKPCVSARRRQTHQGKPHPWGEAAKQRLSDLGKTPNLQLGTAAAKLSPIAGPFETNQEAKVWWLLGPGSQRYQVRNLRKFCRDHPYLFIPDPWGNAYAGLRQVQAWLTGKTPRKVSQWKGWTLERPAFPPEELEELEELEERK